MVYLLHQTCVQSAVAILNDGFMADALPIERGANFSLLETAQLPEYDEKNAHPWARMGCFMVFDWKGPTKIVSSDNDPVDAPNLLYDYPDQRHFVRRTTKNLLYFVGATIGSSYLHEFPMTFGQLIRYRSRQNASDAFFSRHTGQPVTVHLLPAN
jgi:hypothetical protein